MIATSTATTIVAVILGLCVLLMIVSIFRRNTAALPRLLVIVAVLGGVLYLLDRTRLEQLSFRGIRDELFPPPVADYAYQVVDTRSTGGEIRYVFTERSPKLDLVLDRSGQFFRLEDPEPVNRVLRFLGLPEVGAGVPELKGITGRVQDASTYRWDDYAQGILVVNATLCQDPGTVQAYSCIQVLSVRVR